MRRPAPLLALPLCALCCLSCHAGDASRTVCEPLAGEEITGLFADVIDRAAVEDGVGGTAVNHWCQDGRFVSRWTSPAGPGEIEGRWWVSGDLRCVSVEDPLPGDGATRRCVPLLRCGERIASVNAKGGIHGWHVLEPSPCPLD